MARKKKSEDLYDSGFCDVCICAVRYSLGRRTYMPSLVTSYIGKHLDKFNDNQLSILERDIFEHGRSYIPVHNDFGYTTLELGDLNRINTNKYRRYRILPYRLFHFLESMKRKPLASN